MSWVNSNLSVAIIGNVSRVGASFVAMAIVATSFVWSNRGIG